MINQPDSHFVYCEAQFIDRADECKFDIAIVKARTLRGQWLRYGFNPYMLEKRGMATATTNTAGDLDFTFDTNGLLNVLNYCHYCKAPPAAEGSD